MREAVACRSRLSSFVSRTVIGQSEQRIGTSERIGAAASILNLWQAGIQKAGAAVSTPAPGATNRQVNSNSQLASVMASLFKIVCGLIRDLTGLYRPERHYMRGPGPAWRAKHPPKS